MTKIKLAVQGNRIALLSHIELVAGTIGQVCQFFFDNSWDNLNKIITYKIGDTIIASEELKSSEAIVPPKVLATAGLPVEIGIAGYTADNSILYPTSWCLVGYVLPSAHGRTINHNTEIVYDGGVII